MSEAFRFQTFAFFDMIVVFEITHLWGPQKLPTNYFPPYFHKKWIIDGIHKHVTNFKKPHSLICGRHKCMLLFWFFKIWSFTYLNANEILSFSVKLSSFIKETKLIFPTYQLFFEKLFSKFMSVTFIYVRYS